MSQLRNTLSVFVLILAMGQSSFAIEPFIFNDTSNSVIIGEYVEVYEDTSNILTVEEIINKSISFKKSNANVPNLGISYSSFWLHFKIINHTSNNHVILNLSYPLMDVVELYTFSDEKYTIEKTGDTYPFSHRSYTTPDYLSELNIPKNGEREYYIKVNCSQALMIPLSIGVPNLMIKRQTNKRFIFGLYVGVMLIMFLYNLFIYFTVKDKNYLYYIFYVLFIGLTQACFLGYPFQYLWPNQLWVSNHAVYLVNVVGSISILFFIKSFLKVKYHTPKWTYILDGLICTYIIISIIIVMDYKRLAYSLSDVGGIMVASIALILAIRISFKGYKPAQIFLVAWALFLLGIIFFVLRSFGQLPYNIWTNYTMIIGNAIEVIIISLALAEYINKLKKEKSDIQFRMMEADKLASLGMMLSGVGHSMKDPINYVQSMAKMLNIDVTHLSKLIKGYQNIGKLENGLNVEEVKEILGTVDEGTGQIKHIVKSLDNYVNTEKQRVEKIDINACIDTTIRISTMSNNYEGKIEREYGENVFTSGYPTELNQVLLNIIGNAFHTVKLKQEKGSVKIKTQNRQGELLIEIMDNGMGMNEATLGNAFNAFYTTKSPQEGTGLGLYISKEIINKHQGKINIHSEEGIGSTFQIYLPINEDQFKKVASGAA